MTSIALLPDASIVTRSPSAPVEPSEPAPPTADELRAARNRRNAQRSTGPRTPAGKQRSSQNATAHGLTSTTPPPDLARDPDFQQAKAELWEEYRPASPTQVVLVNQLAHLTWKLDQIPRLERQLLATPLGESTPAPLPPGDAPPPAADLTVELTACHLLHDRPTPLTRLWDLHRRLLARAQSIIRQLLQLRTHHQKRVEEDAALAADLAQSERADKANATERTFQLRQRYLEEERMALAAAAAAAAPSPAQPCQGAPNAAIARQTTPSPGTPAQNEPTPPSLSVSSVSSAAEHSSPAAQPGATPRNKTPHSDPPAQNEPTTNHGQRTLDNRHLTL